jgi:outer membrane cobalamin receptor
LGRWLDYDGPIDARLARTAVGAWVQQTVPIPGVIVEPGLRVDWNTWTRETAVQPRLRVTRTIGDSSVLWAGLAWQAQTPGFETMQHGIQYYDFIGPAAADVRNEQMRQVVVGLDRRLPGAMTIRVEAYHWQFERLVVQRAETELERQQRLARYDLPPDLPPDSAILEFRPTVDPESTGRGRASGLEGLLDRKRGRVTGWVSYTLGNSARELFGRTVPFDFDRRHALTLAINVVLISKLRASVRSQHASGFPITPLHEEVVFNDDANVFPGPPPGTRFRPARRADGSLFMHTSLYDEPRISLLSSTRVAPYGRTDVRITYTIDKRFEVYGEIINLFDRENFEVLVPDVTGPNRMPVTYQIAPAFPRLVTNGVRFKF